MKRGALVVLFGAAAACFAVSLRTAPAWLMLAVALAWIPIGPVALTAFDQ